MRLYLFGVGGWDLVSVVVRGVLRYLFVGGFAASVGRLQMVGYSIIRGFASSSVGWVIVGVGRRVVRGS